jgi:hypothetical protein
MMLDKYRNLVRLFSQDEFLSPSIQDNMCIKLFNGKSPHGDTGDKLWRKFKDWRKKIRTEYMPKLPKEIADYPSGHSLRDVYKKFTVECYNAEHGASLITLQNCLYSIFQSNQNFFVQYLYRKLSVGADDEEELLRQMPKDYWLRGGSNEVPFGMHGPLMQQRNHHIMFVPPRWTVKRSTEE